MVPAVFAPFQSAAYPCYWRDGDTAELYMNDAARAFGLSDAVGRTLAEYALLPAAQPQLLPVSDGPRAWTLTIMPLAGGLLATLGGQAPPPISQLGGQLREPITSIFATLPLLSKKLDGADARYAEEIQANCYSLLRLATNLETMYLPATHYANTSPFDFAALVRSLGQSAEAVCSQQGVPLSTQVPPLVLPVNGSARLAGEAILNVLRNSLQFTRDGNAVSLRLRQAGRRAVLTIEDFGLGIKPEHLGHIFEAYYSADPYGDGNPAPGMGLGLCVAHQVVCGLGGSISAESTFGKGSRVVISLPLADDIDAQALDSQPVDYLLNRYSAVYVQLCGYCRLPGL